MDFKTYINRQKKWSLETFGEGKRTDGISEHIRHELQEINQAQSDFDKLEECIDVIILTMDMCWRLGYSPDVIEMALQSKQEINFKRQWPDKSISEANLDKPTFHIKEDTRNHSPSE